MYGKECNTTNTLTKTSYAVLTACTIGHFMHHLYTGALSPLLPTIRTELSLTLTEAGLLTSASIFTMTLVHLFIGVLSDRGLGERLISLSILLTAIAVLLTSLANTFLSLLVCQILVGLGASMYHPPSFPILARHFPRRDRAKATGTQAMGGLVGSAVIPALGVALLTVVGTWQMSLVTLALVGLVMFPTVYMLMRGAQATPSSHQTGPDTAAADEPTGWTRNFVLLVLIAAFRSIPFRCTVLLMPLYLVVSYGVTPLWAGSLTTIMLFAGLAAEVISGPLSDRSGRRRPYVIASTAVMTPCLLLLNFALAPPLLLLVLIIIGFSYYWGVPANTALETEVTPRQSRGLAFGILFSIGSMPGAFAPTIFGFIGDNYGLYASIIFLAIASLMASVVAFFIDERRGVRDTDIKRAYDTSTPRGPSDSTATMRNHG